MLCVLRTASSFWLAGSGLGSFCEWVRNSREVALAARQAPYLSNIEPGSLTLNLPAKSAAISFAGRMKPLFWFVGTDKVVTDTTSLIKGQHL